VSLSSVAAAPASHCGAAARDSEPLAAGQGQRRGSGREGRARQGHSCAQLGRYEEAIEHLSQAYTLTQDPSLLFSLGQAHRLAGQPDKALASYSSFLRAAGSMPKYRTQLERATAEIEAITSTRACSIGRRSGPLKKGRWTI